MSQIVIFVDDRAAAPTVLMNIQRATRHGLDKIRDAISHGKPIFEQEIFDASYDSHAATIRAIVACLENESVVFRIYEIPEGEKFAECAFVKNCQISSDVLKNILNQADAELDRQLDGE
jgi:hypothetical protein